ncbi:MAG: LamG domain-containing protein, partial [Victivallales bacterium]
IINTDKGNYSVSANQALPAGKHQLAGVYDGKSIRLYIDGKLINEAPARGKICENAAPVVVGNISGGNTAFEGIIEKVEIFYRALSLEQIKKQL